MLAGPVSGLRATISVPGAAAARAAAPMARVIAIVVFGLSTSSLGTGDLSGPEDRNRNAPLGNRVAGDLRAVGLPRELRTLLAATLIGMRAARMETRTPGADRADWEFRP